MNTESDPDRLESVKLELRQERIEFIEIDGHLLAIIPSNLPLSSTARIGLDGQHWSRRLFEFEQVMLGRPRRPTAEFRVRAALGNRSSWDAPQHLTFDCVRRKLRKHGVTPAILDEFAEHLIRDLVAKLNEHGAPYQFFWLLLVPPRKTTTSVVDDYAAANQ